MYGGWQEREPAWGPPPRAAWECFVLRTESRNARVVPSVWLVAACLAAVYLIWGTTYFALKVGLEGAGPYYLVGTRFVVAGGLLMAWLRMRGHRLPNVKEWLGAALLGFLLLVVGLGSVTVAERWVSSGAAVALISLMPLATALWSGVFGKRLRRLEWAAIALGGLGTAVMITGHDLRASPTGTILILLAITSWSFGTVLSRRIETPHGAMGFAAEMLAGGVMALIASAALGESWTLPRDLRVWWAWAYLIVFGSLIAFSAYRFLVERISASLAATYAYVNPPVALLVGWGLGSESFSANVLVGLPIVLAAVALHGWIQLRAAAAERSSSADSSASGAEAA
jgi:drug/metabolite transporter (DMT)-like permease